MINRNYATSFTICIFAILGFSGILMFFHIFDKHTKVVHEIFGLSFVLISIFHIFYNKTQFKKYFIKKEFFIACFVSLLACSILIFKKRDSPSDEIILRILNSPLENSFIILSGDYDTAKIKLENVGIKIQNANSLLEICKINKISPSDLARVLLK